MMSSEGISTRHYANHCPLVLLDQCPVASGICFPQRSDFLHSLTHALSRHRGPKSRLNQRAVCGFRHSDTPTEHPDTEPVKHPDYGLEVPDSTSPSAVS